MSEIDRETGILTRDELDAILETLAEEARSDASAPFRREGEDHDTGALVQGLHDFAEEQGRGLSALHQRPLRFSLLRWESTTQSEFADTLLDLDRVVVLELEPGAAIGYLTIGRTLLFSWLDMALGARAGGPRAEIPARPYSRIEERFLLRVAREIASQLEVALSRSRPVTVRVAELTEPALIPRQSSERTRMASFDVSGFGEVCRLRLVLPERLLERGGDAPEARRDESRSPLRERMQSVPVRLKAEVGGTDFSLRRLAELREGDVLPLEPADPEGIVLCVEDSRRFRAERGAVGPRLAVQLIEPI